MSVGSVQFKFTIFIALSCRFMVLALLEMAPKSNSSAKRHRKKDERGDD